MERRRLGVTATAKLLGFDQGYLSKWLTETRGGRGCSALLAYRMTKEFGIDPDLLFNHNPDERFWRTYVPRPAPEDPGQASTVDAQPPRRRAPGGGDGGTGRKRGSSSG